MMIILTPKIHKSRLLPFALSAVRSAVYRRVKQIVFMDSIHFVEFILSLSKGKYFSRRQGYAGQAPRTDLEKNYIVLSKRSNIMLLLTSFLNIYAQEFTNLHLYPSTGSGRTGGESNELLFQNLKTLNNKFEITKELDKIDLFKLDSNQETLLSLARTNNEKLIENTIQEYITSAKHIRNRKFNQNDKHFIILIASYNNAQWYQQNLDSLFEQTYKNFTAIYMDDISNDGTAELVESYINKKYPEYKNQFILIKNSEKRYCLGNYIFAVQRFCPDNSIIITYDGDDWFANKYVLNYLNKLYQNKDIWVTYGQSIKYPTKRTCTFCRYFSNSLLDDGKLRKKILKDNHWPIHHLRSFYTQLFRKIKYEDFLDENKKLFTYAEDVAFMLPMIEMSKNHIKYISTVLYVYNIKNPLCTMSLQGHEKIRKVMHFICNKPYYNALKSIY